MNIYQFDVKDVREKTISLKQFENKVILIVNTATRCGLTAQYDKLEAIYRRFKDRGFVLLDFPCNQFLQQAPETPLEIEKFCQDGYDVTFPIMDKIDVNGENTIPLFKYLKEELPVDYTGEDVQAKEFNKSREEKYHFTPQDVHWNFTKFLIDRNGKPVRRYAPKYSLEQLEEDIDQLLK